MNKPSSCTESYDPRFEQLVLFNAELELLAEGFRWLEGPVWYGDHHCLLFNDIPSKNFGLNYDPSHMILQRMDYLTPMREFKDRLHHMHAKDVRFDYDKLNEVGQFAYPNQYHTPKLPGLGDVDWGKFYSVLSEVYQGPVCIEVEDRAYEGSLELRQAALKQSGRYLRGFQP